MTAALLVSDQHLEPSRLAPATADIPRPQEGLALIYWPADSILEKGVRSFRIRHSSFESQENFCEEETPPWRRIWQRQRVRHTRPQEAESALAKIRAIQTRQENRRREEAEAEWISLHRSQYAGRWVALLGSDLIAAGDSAKVVAEAARSAASTPLIVYIDHDLPFAGW